MKKSKNVANLAHLTGAVAGLTLAAAIVSIQAEAAPSDTVVSPPAKLTQQQMSPTIKNKILILRQAQIDNAAKVIKGLGQGSAGYSDFFVDDGKNPWHEAFTDRVTSGRITVLDPSQAIPSQLLNSSSQSRLAFLKTFNNRADAGYSDFFVDDGKNPWHEAFADRATVDSLRTQESLRASAVSKLKVIQAFKKIQQTGTGIR
jgi:hypothetical protein